MPSGAASVSAADDTAVAPLDYKTLTQRSAAAAGSAHPLLLSMQRSSGAGEALSIAHNAFHTATRLADRRVLVAGGDTGTEVRRVAELFTP